MGAQQESLGPPGGGAARTGFTQHGGELGKGLSMCWGPGNRLEVGAENEAGGRLGGCQGSSEARLMDVMESHGQKQSMKTGSLTCIS